MTNNLSTLHNSHSRTLGDVAVDGLINGVGAGMVMAGALAIMALVMGEPLETMFSRFNSANAEVPLVAGVLGHLAVSAIYGTVFGVLWHRIGKPVSGLAALVIGVLYSLLLFALAQIVILPAVQSPMLEIPTQFALAHLVYGLTLGALFGRRQR